MFHVPIGLAVTLGDIACPRSTCNFQAATDTLYPRYLLFVFVLVYSIALGLAALLIYDAASAHGIH
jgi:hypothetical protein